MNAASVDRRKQPRGAMAREIRKLLDRNWSKVPTGGRNVERG